MTDQTEGTEPAEKPDEETLDYEAALARLNEEYDREQPERTEPEKPKDDDLAAIRAELEHLRAHVEGDQTKRAIDEAMAAVKGDAELTISDRHLRAMLIGEVSDNPTLLKAYRNRNANPAGWKSALKVLGRDIHKEFGKRETTETSDVEAVEASVRGQQTHTAPRKIDATRTGNMTDAEFAKWREEAIG